MLQLSIQQLHPKLAKAAYQYFLEGKMFLSIVKDTAESLGVLSCCGLDSGSTETIPTGQSVSLAELHICSAAAADCQML